MLSLLQFCLLIEVVPVILIYMLFVIFRWSNDNLWMKEKKNNSGRKDLYTKQDATRNAKPDFSVQLYVEDLHNF